MRKTLLFVSLVIITVSCIRDVDFDQVDTAIFSTQMSVALLHLELNQHDFLDDNNDELTKVEKLFLIDLSEFFKESTTSSLDYVTQFSNSFNREFSCQFEFLNKDDDILMTTEAFYVPASSTAVVQSLSFEGEEFDRFLEARWINVSIFLRNGDAIIPSEFDNLDLQTVIHFDYEIAPSS